MCGIAGIIGESDTEAVRKMLSAIHHRGPDDSGIFSDDLLTIGMNRLAIIDLSQAGHQPMSSQDGRYQIVFNGEVFNYGEIREGLIKKGHSFKSSTDTEVILRAYMEYGPGCLEHFRGMFAFIIYDSIDKSVFGARDRFGIKPLYYSFTGKRFVFASELKALVASGYIPFEICNNAVSELMLFGSICTSQQTAIRNVQMFPAGHFFVLKGTELKIHRYWTLESKEEYATLSYPQAVETLMHKIKESVALRLISDRPIGLFLSSGVDSVALAVAAKELGRTDLLTYTLGFENEATVYDESQSAKSIATYLGLQNKTFRMDASDFPKYFNDFVDAIDQPSIDGLNTFLISKFARKDLVVALSGLGGDELMGGYLRNRAIADRNTNSSILPDALIRFINSLAYNPKFSHRALKMLFRFVRAKDPAWNYLLSRIISDVPLMDKLFQQNHVNLSIHYRAFKQLTNKNATIAQQISQLEIGSYMTPQLLRDMDAASMHSSMEVRFPLIDHRLTEFIYSLPDNYKTDRSQRLSSYREGTYSYQEYGAKRILMDALRPHLPASYFEAKKRGFKLPIHKWMNDNFREEILDLLTPSSDTVQHFSAQGLVEVRKNFEKQGSNNTVYLIFLFLKWKKRMESFADTKKKLH